MLKVLLKVIFAPSRLCQIVLDRLAPLWLRLSGVQFDAGLIVSGYPVVRFADGAKIKFGRNVKLFSRRSNNPMQLSSPCTLWTSKPDATISIGNDSALSGAIICAAIAVHIGERVLIGANSRITDTDFHPVSPRARREHPTNGAVTKPVVIGDDVWIGMNAIILPGTNLGNGCVVAAGAVVSGMFPSDTVLVGNPARVIKKVDLEGQIA